MFFKSVKYVYDEDNNRKTDANGRYVLEDLTEQEQVAVQEKVQNLFNEISEGKDIGPEFEKLMPEFGFDVASYPNGFYITADEYSLHTATVTSAALDMEVNEVRLAENEDCYFIIKKFDLIEKAYAGVDNGQFAYLATYANNYKFVNYFDKLLKDLVFDESFSLKYKLSEI